MGLYEAMKKAAQAERAASVPCAIMFGEVKKAAPLEIMVDNRFIISGDMIILPRDLRAGTYPKHTHVIDPHKHSTPMGDSGTTGLETKRKAGENEGLSVGEKVILIRNEGGQQFLVFGRL